MVDFLLYAASLDASVATRSKMSEKRVSRLNMKIKLGWSDIPLTKEFKMDMARLEIPVSGWTCFKTKSGGLVNVEWKTRLDVDMRVGEGRVDWKRERHAADAPGVVEKTRLEKTGAYLCRCMRSRSPCASWCASSSRQLRQSSCQLPSSQRGPWRQVPWRRASSRQRLWEAF